jgi:hypothetical protein
VQSDQYGGARDEQSASERPLVGGSNGKEGGSRAALVRFHTEQYHEFLILVMHEWGGTVLGLDFPRLSMRLSFLIDTDSAGQRFGPIAR